MIQKRKREFQAQWLFDVKWLRQELGPENGMQGEAKGYCFMCRQFPTYKIYADKNSGLFDGMVLKKRDMLYLPITNLPSMSSAKQKMTRKMEKKVTGKTDIAFAKVDQSECERYNKRFNTVLSVYGIAKGNKPYFDYPLYCELQTKNGLNLGSDHLGVFISSKHILYGP